MQKILLTTTLLFLLSITGVFAYTPNNTTEKVITTLTTQINEYSEEKREMLVYVLGQVLERINKVDIIEGPFEVLSVVDGDTIKVNYYGISETIRIVGIDTPETKHPTKGIECGGPQASNNTKRLLEGKKVYMKRDSQSNDRGYYGRLIRYILIDGVDFGEIVVGGGFGKSYGKFDKLKMYKELEQKASDEGVGVWGCE